MVLNLSKHEYIVNNIIEDYNSDDLPEFIKVCFDNCLSICYCGKGKAFASSYLDIVEIIKVPIPEFK